jgi:hypothetical protein
MDVNIQSNTSLQTLNTLQYYSIGLVDNPFFEALGQILMSKYANA